MASEFAIADAKLNLDAEDKERVGVFIGNVIGGWEFAEVELRDLYAAGLKEVSPYQATAWFPAAPQGQISIYYGLLGYSQTIIADSASGLVSIGSAYRAIQEGEADVILAGGSEAPISPYAFFAAIHQERLQTGMKIQRLHTGPLIKTGMALQLERAQGL